MKLRDQMLKYVNISKKKSQTISDMNLHLEIYYEVKIVTLKLLFYKNFKNMGFKKETFYWDSWSFLLYIGRILFCQSRQLIYPYMYSLSGQFFHMSGP